MRVYPGRETLRQDFTVVSRWWCWFGRSRQFPIYQQMRNPQATWETLEWSKAEPRRNDSNHRKRKGPHDLEAFQWWDWKAQRVVSSPTLCYCNLLKRGAGGVSYLRKNSKLPTSFDKSINQQPSYEHIINTFAFLRMNGMITKQFSLWIMVFIVQTRNKAVGKRTDEREMNR